MSTVGVGESEFDLESAIVPILQTAREGSILALGTVTANEYEVTIALIIAELGINVGRIPDDDSIYMSEWFSHLDALFKAAKDRLDKLEFRQSGDISGVIFRMLSGNKAKSPGRLRENGTEALPLFDFETHVIAEVWTALCGSSKNYSPDRTKLANQLHYAIGAISGSIAAKFGVQLGAVAALVTNLMLFAAKVGLAAFCRWASARIVKA